MDNIFLRQRNIKLHIPDQVIVVGVGGVGSWVALNFALIGTKKLVLIDPDTLEPHNLNRTPYAIRHVGMPKVVAMAELINERRGDGGCDVIVCQCRSDDVPKFVRETEFLPNAVCIDCRDEVSPMPEDFPKTPITGGYNGKNITIHVNPDMDKVFSVSAVEYTETPSYVVPPVVIASIIVEHVCSGIGGDEEIINADLHDMVGLIRKASQVVPQEAK